MKLFVLETAQEAEEAEAITPFMVGILVAQAVAAVEAATY